MQCFSVLDPSKNSNAADLPETTNNRNMRSMRISCQVTAAISLLEIFGNIFNSVIWLFTAKYVGNESLVLGLILYFILLPYTFLMNTHDNRNLVVEEGWEIVIKNLFSGFKIIQSFNSNHVQNCDFKKNPVGSEKDYLTERDIRFQLYAVSRQCDTSKISNNHNEICTLNVPNHENEDYMNTDNSTTSNRHVKGQKYRHIISIRSYCINKMLCNLKNENFYMALFKTFVQLEKTIDNGDEISPIVQFIQIQVITPENIQRDNEKSRYDYICSLEKRTEMRKILLKILLKQNNIDDTMYKRVVKDIIRLESNLIK